MTFKSKVWSNPDKLRCPECGSVCLGLSGVKKSTRGRMRQRYVCKKCDTVTLYPKGGKS